MALTTGERQQIFTRLAPVIGEQEAGTLLDQFPSTADTELATVGDVHGVRAELAAMIDRVDAKIDRAEVRLTAKIDLVEARLEKALHRALRNQTILMLTTIVAVLGLAARTNLFG